MIACERVFIPFKLGHSNVRKRTTEMPSTLKLRSCTLFFHFTPYFQIVPHLKRASELNVYIILHFWYQLLFNITFIEWSETANERIERITRSALFNSNIKFSSSYSTFGGVVVVIWLLYGSSGFFLLICIAGSFWFYLFLVCGYTHTILRFISCFLLIL